MLARMIQSGRVSGRREHHKAITAIAEWPAIITPEQSDRLRAIAEVNRRRRRRVSRRYLLTGGLARCGCGQVMVSRPKQDGRRGYICARETGGCGVSILADEFEAWVSECAIAAVDSEKLAALVAERDDDGAAAVRLHAVEERTATLATDYAAGRLPDAAYRAGLDVLEADRRAALAELTAVSGPDPLAGLDGPLAAVSGGPGDAPAACRARSPDHGGDGRPGRAWTQPLRRLPAVDHVAGVINLTPIA